MRSHAPTWFLKKLSTTSFYVASPLVSCEMPVISLNVSWTLHWTLKIYLCLNLVTYFLQVFSPKLRVTKERPLTAASPPFVQCAHHSCWFIVEPCSFFFVYPVTHINPCTVAPSAVSPRSYIARHQWLFLPFVHFSSSSSFSFSLSHTHKDRSGKASEEQRK